MLLTLDRCKTRWATPDEDMAARFLTLSRITKLSLANDNTFGFDLFFGYIIPFLRARMLRGTTNEDRI